MHYRAFLFIKFIRWSASPLSEEREKERESDTIKENSHCPTREKMPKAQHGFRLLRKQ